MPLSLKSEVSFIPLPGPELLVLERNKKAMMAEQRAAKEEEERPSAIIQTLGIFASD